jgi:hypothetical protein
VKYASYSLNVLSYGRRDGALVQGQLSHLLRGAGNVPQFPPAALDDEYPLPVFFNNFVKLDGPRIYQGV